MSLTVWPQVKTGPHGGVSKPQKLRGMLIQAKGRSSYTAGNSGSLQRESLPSQKPPGLCWAGCKAPGFERGCLSLSQKAPTSKNVAADWHGCVAKTQPVVWAGRRKKQQDCREC